MKDAGQVIPMVIILVIGIFFAIGGYESFPDGCKFFHQGIEACQLTGSGGDLSLSSWAWDLAELSLGPVNTVFLFRGEIAITCLASYLLDSDMLRCYGTGS